MLSLIQTHSEFIGHLGSGLILVSMMMSNLKWLRVINCIGASTFAFYGYLINSYPVLIMDGLIACASLFYLVRMVFQKDYFTLNDTLKGHEFFIKNFLQFYKEDILSFFPDFDLSLKSYQNPKIFVVSRKIVPVGLFIYEVKEEGHFQVHLDFAVPAYRDLKNFLYITETCKKHWEKEGLHTMIVETKVKKHMKYLKKVGFKKDKDNKTLFYFPL